jgi:hypothetical protein
MSSSSSNGIRQFADDVQTELDQIRNEYQRKYADDRTLLEREIHGLIDDERRTFEKLKRYLNDQRHRTDKRQHKKVKT